MPKQGLGAKRDAELAQKLADYKASLSEAEIEKLIADTKHLHEYQDEPSPKEDLEKIPMLTREDLKKTAAPLYNEVVMSGDTEVVYHEMYANGIDYLQLLL